MGIYLKCSPQDEPVYQFLDHKRSEGKPFYVYMTVCIQQVSAALLRTGAGLSFYIGQSASGRYGFHRAETKRLT